MSNPTIQVPLGSASTGPSYRLLQRQCIVSVGSTLVENLGDGLGLRIGFEVRNTLKPQEPNTANVKLYNLAPSTRQAIQAAAQPSATPGVSAVPVKINAGYAGTIATIYQGYVRAPQSMKDNTLVVTELDSGDGDQAISVARVNASLPKGSTALSAVQAILSAAGIGTGNLNAANVQSLLRGQVLFSKGAVLKGNGVSMLIDLCASVGLEFSIQRGQAQFLPLGLPASGTAYVLSAAFGSDGLPTGLIGSPTVDAKGVLSCVSLLIPGLLCGGPIQLASEFVTGLFRIHAITYNGDTGTKEPWFAHIEAARYGVPV